MAAYSDELTRSGFSEQEIYEALDFCDNDRIKTLKYLKKKNDITKNPQALWLHQIASATSPNPTVRQALDSLRQYENIPRKEKKFRNFLSNSCGIRDAGTATLIWQALEQAKVTALAASKGNGSGGASNSVVPDSSGSGSAVAAATETSSESKKRKRDEGLVLDGDASQGKKDKKD